jgi:hypothetical protein
VLVQPDNSQLITRVEGQTRDLGVTLQVAPGGWARGAAEQAAAIARERNADFVARVKRGANGVLEVRIYAAASATLRARRVPHAKSERLGTSAELEAAALVLRGELTSLIEAEREAAAARETAVTDGGTGGSGSPPGAAGGTPNSGAGTGTSRGGSSQRQPEPKPPKPALQPKPDEEDRDRTSDESSDEPDEDEEEPDEEAEEEEEEPSAPLENYTAHRTAWTLRGGARGSSPIESHVAGALVLGARAPIAFLEIGLALSTALPLEVSSDYARITLWRSALTAEALAVIPVGPRLRALLGVDVGVVLYARSTDRVDPKFLPAESKPSWAATLGAQAELQWLLTRQFGVALGLALAYVPQRTRFAYTENPSQPHEIAVLRSFEPQATVSLFGLVGD